MTAAERMRRMRARRALERDGYEQFSVWVKTDRLVVALSEDGFLSEWDEDNRPAVDAAFAQMIAAFIVTMAGGDDVTARADAVCFSALGDLHKET
jgi:hypothetical protein